MKQLILAVVLSLLAVPAMADQHDAFFRSLEEVPATTVQGEADEASLSLEVPAPTQLSSFPCEPMPPLCDEVNKEQEYCDCVNAGGNSGFCRCRWCLGESVEMCKVHKPVP